MAALPPLRISHAEMPDAIFDILGTARDIIAQGNTPFALEFLMDVQKTVPNNPHIERLITLILEERVAELFSGPLPPPPPPPQEPIKPITFEPPPAALSHDIEAYWNGRFREQQQLLKKQLDDLDARIEAVKRKNATYVRP